MKHAQLESVKAWIQHPDHQRLRLPTRIQRALRQLILDGSLSVGDQLPASRQLARTLSVSRDTVEQAYNHLHMEGFIDRHVGSGSRVSTRVQALLKKRILPPAPIPLTLSQRGKQLVALGEVSNAVVPRSFAPGVPETRFFPLALWERLTRQLYKEHDTSLLYQSPPQGAIALRQAIARYVALERGAQATAEQVLILTSTQQALQLCASVLFDEGDSIFIEDPVYQGATKAFKANGLRCVPIPVDERGLQVEALLSSPTTAKGVFVTPSHQYPSGSTLSVERRLALIDWAQQQHAWIIEDDYDSEFHYAHSPIACVQGLDRAERTIYIGTFTKSLFPGLRLAYMVLPPPLVTVMTAARTLIDGHTASISQLSLARFIDEGYFSSYIQQMCTLYAQRRDHLVQLLQHTLPNFLHPHVPSDGMQMTCTLHESYSEQKLHLAALRHNVLLHPLSGLYANAKGAQQGFLMGFAAYNQQEMAAGVEIIKRLV